MARQTNGSGGRPSVSKIRSPEASDANVLPFPGNLKQRRELEQMLAAYLTGLVAGVLSHQFSIGELELLVGLSDQFDSMRELPPGSKT
jgi:hypothetical protein